MLNTILTSVLINNDKKSSTTIQKYKLMYNNMNIQEYYTKINPDYFNLEIFNGSTAKQLEIEILEDIVWSI